jgi:catechol 2,3-dioxygenase-like lactoylglutathione lyase family enzyme
VFKHPDYVMVTVSDMQQSVSFYRDLLGLPLKFESPEWTEFATGTTTLALHGGAKPALAPQSDKQAAGVCSLGFNVKSLDEAYQALKSRGVVFTLPPTNREGEGIRLAVAIDPDGLSISFAESKR